jgi:hypothetical protein
MGIKASRAMRACLALTSAWCLALPAPARAEGPGPAPILSAPQVDDARLRQLAAHPTWHGLLHMDAAGRSEINSPGFFLSPTGAHDAEAELRATLAAYSQPWPDDPNTHPRCSHPSRYFWLSRQLQLPGWRDREPRCLRLEEWGRFDHLQSISVYLVSGYLGNPASTFGHALIKFNTEDAVKLGGLTDVSVNFGALVPPNEPTLRYVYRGLFGGYQAGFSDKYHYTNDQVYGKRESRDMWDYELQLTPDQRLFLAYHLAEVAGRKFDYYFLTKNCGLRIADVLALVTGQPLGQSARLWYAPVEMFNTLHALDQPPQTVLGGPPRFVPSAERMLNAEFSRLDAVQRSVANEAIRDDLQHLGAHLSTLPPEQRLDVLDTLLAYQTYRLEADGAQVDEAMRRAKDRILLARLQALPRQRPPLEVPQLKSPAQGHAPMMLAAGWLHDTHTGDDKLRLQWAPFRYELGGFHGLDRSELAVFDTVVDVGAHGATTLTQFDLIRVRKLDTNPAYIEGANGLSWEVQTGMRRVVQAGRERRQSHLSGGVGFARQWGSVTAFAMVDASAQSGPHPLAAGPQLSMTGQLGDDLKWVLRSAWRQDLGSHEGPHRNGLAELVWRTAQNRAWRLSVDHQDRTRFVAMFQQYW